MLDSPDGMNWSRIVLAMKALPYGCARGGIGRSLTGPGGS